MADAFNRKVRFERNAARVIFDAERRLFVVTWSKCDASAEARKAARKNPEKWLPSVSAVTTIFDRGNVSPEQVVPAALSIGRAWEAGDRELLDTEGARKAAELVRDLASMCVNASSPAVACDLGQAIRHLIDEMAYVRFANFPRTRMDPEKVLFDLTRALDSCLAVDGFLTWEPRSQRRKFIFCLRDKKPNEFVGSLVSLLFEVGSCPLLSLSDRRALRLRSVQASGLDERLDRTQVLAFLRFAVDAIVQAKDEGKNRLGQTLTQQQLTDCLADSYS